MDTSLQDTSLIDETLKEAVIPIREISRLTGVNSVTLRAWERRYGLIKPLRTHKGHRLYRSEDVALVKKIQAWLARGLAIGKVSELLESDQVINENELENTWQEQLNELLEIMADLNLGRFDAFFNRIFSVYPAALIADQLIIPALECLRQEVFGNNVKNAILIHRLSEYLLMLTQRQRPQANGKRVAIIQLSAAANPLLNVLLHYGLTLNQTRSELLGLMSASEMLFAVEQLSLDAVIVYNDSCTSLGDFQKELMLLANKIPIPIILGGKLASAVDVNLPASISVVQTAGQQALVSAFINTVGDSEL